MKRLTFIGAAIALVVTLLSSLGGQAAAAGSATFSLSPSSNTVSINTVFGVTVYENGTDVNVVTADLTYDASKLEFVSIDASGSAFANSVSASGGSGSVGISRYTAPGSTVNGNQKVATVNFKAVVGSGTANVSMASSSKIVSNGVDTWNHAAVSGTYTLVTPASTPAPTPAPTQNNAPKTSSAPSATKTATSTTPTGAVLAIDTQQSATISEQAVAPPQADQPVVAAMTAKHTSNTFRNVMLGLVALLVAAVVTVTKLVQAKEARQTKSQPKTKKNKK